WRRGRDGTSGLPPATLFAMGVLAERQRVDAARMPIPRARRFGRKSWPSLRRRMRRKRAQVASIPRPVVLEAHGLGLGAAQVPGDEHRDPRSVAGPTPEGTGSGTPADVERAGAPPLDGRGHPSAMRRLVGG